MYEPDYVAATLRGLLDEHGRPVRSDAPGGPARLAQLDRRGRRQQHRQPGPRVARRGAPLAQHDPRPRLAGIERGGDLGGDLARHPAGLRAGCGEDRHRVGVVLVAGLAAQRQRGPGGERRGLQDLVVEARRAGDARDDQPTRGQLRRVAREVASRLGIDRGVARDPDDRAVVAVPVALLVCDGYVNDAQTTSATASWIAADTSAAGCSLLSSHMTPSLPGVSASNTTNPTACAPTPTAP